MGLLEQQNFLAELYTNEDLRNEFEQDPFSVGGRWLLDRSETEDIKAILQDEIEAFAETLFYKRVREVERLLPVTARLCGVSFKKIFRSFSTSFLPSTVKKHLADAINFALYLEKDRTLELKIREIARFERFALEFSNDVRRFRFAMFKYDLRALKKIDSSGAIKRRRTPGIWLKIGKHRIHLIL